MRRRYFQYSYIPVLALIFSSCSTLLIKKDPANTPLHCFDLLWENINQKYAFFDYKHVNWDSVRRVYRPRVSDSISQDSLFTVLSEALYQLKDGHVNINASYDRSRNWSWKDDYPDNFNEAFVHRQYLKRNFRITGPLLNQIVGDSVGYIRYASFGSPISEGDLDYVMDRFKNMKGIIIDVRDNGGGAIDNVFRLMSRFVERPKLVGYAYVKRGKGHNDFASPLQMIAQPAVKKIIFTKQVAVLINRGCFSATTHFAGFMSELPNVTLVGDQTGGGGGLPVSSDLPNGWQYRFSATYETLVNGFNIENGVPPTIRASTGPADELQGKDVVIEKALEVINPKSR